MNQILVTEKVYVTPDLERKKWLYKVVFFLSVLLICLLSSVYIYGAYDRDKTEQVSQQILANIDDTVKKNDNDVMILILDEQQTEEAESKIHENTDAKTYTSESGTKYTTEARLTIPSIKIDYPVLSETSEELLKVSLNKYWGPNPNQVGNYCIVGHNYRNDKLFGNLHKLNNRDKVYLKDMKSGKTIEYQVYDKYIIEATDTRCTSQLTNGRKEITLITCANYGKQRLAVKCREVK